MNLVYSIYKFVVRHWVRMTLYEITVSWIAYDDPYRVVRPFQFRGCYLCPPISMICASSYDGICIGDRLNDFSGYFADCLINGLFKTCTHKILLNSWFRRYLNENDGMNGFHDSVDLYMWWVWWAREIIFYVFVTYEEIISKDFLDLRL